MKRKISMVCGLTVLILALVLINALLPKDFSGYYKNIDMARKEQAEIYDNGVFICTQEADDRQMDFIIGNDLTVIEIKSKDTFLGYKYRVMSIETISDFQEFLKEDIAYYDQHKELSFSYVSWIGGFPVKPIGKVFWSILPAQYSVTNLDDSVSKHNFTYENVEYVLYLKVEKVN